MGTQEATGFCRRCNATVLIRMQTANHVFHLLMALITIGLWIPIWFLCSLSSWRCSRCGATVRRKLFA